ncbi:hypothetical protein OKA04_02200 [Luteolibacter flavescens]|uniref:Uncharacterized protein n=1 Tax=Luteolibacter flavescens TaxID=1859460 RepID=A0ABT3FJQ0_9BACT|nr:hypothetical protein [Luteolibacter flavescens]MCW1883521.1 hypothetical protein [Luteolibacter flavescens]
MKEKPRLVRRAELAENIEKRLKSIIADFDKIPSFKGKSRFMDKIFRVNSRAHNLAWDLRYDASEELAK